MPLPDPLPDGEFLILTERSFHAVGKQGDNAQLSPITLWLTNFSLFIDPTFDMEVARKITVSHISGFECSVVNDIDVLQVLTGTHRNVKIHLFIPDETHKAAFQKLVDHLRQLLRHKRSTFDYGRSLLHRVQSSESLDAFYKDFLKIDSTDNETDPRLSPEELETTPQRVFALLFSISDYFADLLKTSSDLLVAGTAALILVLSVLFELMPFGLFMSALLLVFLIWTGVRKIFKKTEFHKPTEIARTEKSLTELVKAQNESLGTVDRRLFWLVPAETLELGAFVLVVLLLFVLFDPTFLLFLSLVGLAFFDRWDPLGFGSLSAILSQLILW
jgi:hypothetical protein